ncbi:Endonuclease/exonuclease/phosphatase, partial [Russula brevipes]
MFKHKTAILAIQETHLTQGRLKTLCTRYKKNLEIITSADPEAPGRKAGVAFVIDKNKIDPEEITTRALIPGRALWLKLKWLDSSVLTMINVYAPTEKTNHPLFWEKIERERRRLQLPRPDFVLGDFNVIEDAIDRAPAHLDNTNAVEALRNLRMNWGIQDAWRRASPNEREFTYRATVNGTNIKSRIDRIYAASEHHQHLFEWHIGCTTVPTDHWMVQTKFAPKDAPKIGKGRWTCPPALLNNDELLRQIEVKGHQLQHDLDTLANERTNRGDANPQTLWEAFKNDIKETIKTHTRTTLNKISTRIQALEKD